jgi:hypothetical protein
MSTVLPLIMPLFPGAPDIAVRNAWRLLQKVVSSFSSGSMDHRKAMGRKIDRQRYIVHAMGAIRYI